MDSAKKAWPGSKNRNRQRTTCALQKSRRVLRTKLLRIRLETRFRHGQRRPRYVKASGVSRVSTEPISGSQCGIECHNAQSIRLTRGQRTGPGDGHVRPDRYFCAIYRRQITLLSNAHDICMRHVHFRWGLDRHDQSLLRSRRGNAAGSSSSAGAWHGCGKSYKLRQDGVEQNAAS
jgi:hypothetical protein